MFGKLVVENRNEVAKHRGKHKFGRNMLDRPTAWDLAPCSADKQTTAACTQTEIGRLPSLIVAGFRSRDERASRPAGLRAPSRELGPRGAGRSAPSAVGGRQGSPGRPSRSRTPLLPVPSNKALSAVQSALKAAYRAGNPAPTRRRPTCRGRHDRHGQKSPVEMPGEA